MAATVLYTRQIGDGQITAVKIAAAAGIETSKLADGSNFIQRNGSVAFTANQSMGTFKLTNLGAGTAASNDAARMADLTNFAVTTGTLAQFAATTSAQLAGIISDETGTGSLVFSASPTFTGTPLAPTAAAATNTTQIATTAFVRTEVSNLINGAPGALDTLVELATALGNDPNFASTITTSLAGKEPTITAGTTAQYWRGDKTWQTLDKTAVGLGNVDNTSDVNKPVSTATQNALNLVTAKAVVATTTSANITLSGEQTINGFLTSASRILVKDQTTATQNGIYVTGAGAWTRATDFDAWTEIPGATVWVVGGTLANTGWVNTNTTGGTLGSTNITFAQSAGTGTYEPVITAGTTSQYWRGDKTFQTLNTAAVAESSNLYFTNARAITSTLTGYTSGAGTISASDTIIGAIQKLNGNVTALTTTNVAEGTNLYFTTARVLATALTGYTVGANSALAATDTVLGAFGKVQGQINAKEGTITSGTTSQYWRGDKTFVTLDSSVVTENTNLYFTNARAIGSTLTGYTSGAGTITSSDTVLSAIQKLNGNTAALSTTNVSEGTNLYFTTARVLATALTGFAVGSNATIAATDTVLGAFGKTQAQINAKENTITAGTTAQYWRGDKSFQTLDTSAVPENGNLYFTNARAIGATLTGYTSGAGTVAATDSILQAIQKLNGNIAGIIASSTVFVTRETPSGSVNGSNTTFTLAFTPIAGSEELYLNGMMMEPGAGNDYTISGATITMLTAPTTGEKIRVNYRR